MCHMNCRFPTGLHSRRTIHKFHESMRTRMSCKINSEGKRRLLSGNGIALFPEKLSMETLRARVVEEPFSLPDGHVRPDLRSSQWLPPMGNRIRHVHTSWPCSPRKGSSGGLEGGDSQDCGIAGSRDDILLGLTKHVRVRDDKGIHEKVLPQ